MTRLYRLNPISPGSRGLNIGITLPPVAPVPAETECPTSTGGLTWGYLSGFVADIYPFETEDYINTAAYASNTFSATATADLAVWEIDATALTDTLVCRVLSVSGEGSPWVESSSFQAFSLRSGSSATTTLINHGEGAETFDTFLIAPGSIAQIACTVLAADIAFQVRAAVLPSE